MGKLIPNFNEELYLQLHIDVAAAVAAGVIPSGEWHYFHHGINEKRPWDYAPVASSSPLWKAFKHAAPFHENHEDFTLFDAMVTNLQQKKSFHVARYNDGEWVFMLQIEPFFTNYIRDHKHRLDEVLIISKALVDIINRKPPYYIGIDSTTRALHGSILKKKDSFLEMIEPLKNVIYGDIFNAVTIKRGINCLKTALEGRVVITVGPDYMRKLQLSENHILVPTSNCWNQAPEIQRNLEISIDAHIDEHPVVIYSCSLLAKLLVDQGFQRYGDRLTQMDIGSCIDPWCGVSSRPWHPELAKHFKLKLTSNVVVT